jgi:hypothetical protein
MLSKESPENIESRLTLSCFSGVLCIFHSYKPEEASTENHVIVSVPWTLLPTFKILCILSALSPRRISP